MITALKQEKIMHENSLDDVPNFGARWNKPKETFRPLPCLRNEHGEIREQSVKQLFAKINQELDELKEACGFVREHNFDTVGEFRGCQFNRRFDCIDIFQNIAEEAAGVITAITTMLEAIGIDAEMRDEAQRRVNSRNRGREWL